MTLPLIVKKITFFPCSFKVDTLENLQPYLEKLLASDIQTLEKFETFLSDVSEAEAIISEAGSWIQINITCDTENKIYQEQYEYFYTTIQTYLQGFSNKINKKIIDSPFAKKLSDDYFIYIRNIEKNISLFQEKNIAIHAELSLLQQEYAAVTSQMSVDIDGKIMTLQQASLLLKNKNRDKRKDAYLKINESRLLDKKKLNILFTTLIEKRNAIALNCNYTTYTNYKFKELGRYDYEAQDCFAFHAGIKKYILPLVNRFYESKKKHLQFTALYPWDIDAPAINEEPLKPFDTTNELITKTILCLEKVDTEFAACLQEMQKLKRLDLESRKGKAPGGYNCPLAETGAPFIFMNAVGSLDDVITMVHESGHAVHSFLSHDLKLSGFKEYPMEIAELASMSMELFTMAYWDIFFPNAEELKRAKLQQWERVISIFPWIAMIDKFQHWIYDNPLHTENERTTSWMNLQNEFKNTVIDFSLSQNFMPYSWQKQLHLYEVPFYYIEYGIAQLGAIAMYQQYKKNKSKTLTQYKNALKLGGQYSLKKLYQIAGIEFRFDEHYIQEIFEFVKAEISALEKL